TQQLERRPRLLWGNFCSFPLGFIATLAGWCTAQGGRQPRALVGPLRPAEAGKPVPTTLRLTPRLRVVATARHPHAHAGAYYNHRMLRRGPVVLPVYAAAATNPKRPLSLPGASPGVTQPTRGSVAETVP